MDADSSVKNSTLSASARSPIERAWLSSKNTAIRSFQNTSSAASVTVPMIASWAASNGVIARMLPNTMVWMFTDVGDSEAMNRPRPKKPVKISPMTASVRSMERELTNSIAAAASPPERNAPSE